MARTFVMKEVNGISTAPRLLHSLRVQPRKELSSGTIQARPQGHSSIKKD